MSSEDAKKRKRSDQRDASSPVDVDVQGHKPCDSVAASVAAEKMMADMTAMFDQKVSQMEQKMQREVESLKDRISHVEELESKCQHLEDRCTSLESLVKILAKHWQYSAPGIPPIHWLEQGFEEDYDDAMDSLLLEMKDVVSELQIGNLCISLGQENLPLLLHDHVLLPHWNEVVDALHLYRVSLNDSDGVVSITNVQLPHVALGPLAEAVENMSFSEMALCRNEFANSKDGIEFAIRLIQSGSDLEIFNWTNNLIYDMEDANRLVQAIKSNPSIGSVILDSCCGEGVNGYSILCSLLTGGDHFKTIDFCSNNVVTMGKTHLPDFIATNPHLQILTLDDNNIDDHDAYLIANALRQNNNLQCLSLSRNDMTKLGRSHLRLAIFNSESFESVFNSNHSCIVSGVEMDDNTNNAADFPEGNRRMKIYHLFSMRNSEGTNVSHLDSELGADCLKLSPYLLERLDRCSTDMDVIYSALQPLSIFYEILRSWKMPSLYENHRS